MCINAYAHMLSQDTDFWMFGLIVLDQDTRWLLQIFTDSILLYVYSSSFMCTISYLQLNIYSCMEVHIVLKLSKTFT